MRGRDELIDELIIPVTTQSLFAPTEIKRIVEQRLIVGPYVQADRQGAHWMNARSDDIECELADADGHATCSLVADAENRLVVGNDHQLHVGKRCGIS